MASRYVDRCEQDRRKLARRPRWRFERGIKVRERGCDAKRWAWQRRVWNTYGLAAWDVALAWERQAGRCPICLHELASKRWVLDHRHVKGFRKMPPDVKRFHFRGILCSYCNRYAVGGCERAGRHRTMQVVEYLGWS